MADLIDRHKAIEQAVNESQSEGAYGYLDTKSIVDMLEGLPTIDAVEVVRCKDCVYRRGDACDYADFWLQDDYFCSEGVRKENG